MIDSLHACIVRCGNVVRYELAKPETVARYLTKVSPLADYQVSYFQDDHPHRVTAEGFLALYEAGRFVCPTRQQRQAMARWTWTVEEIAAAVPGGQVLHLPPAWFAAIRPRLSRRQAVFDMLYHWLTTTHGYPPRDLHNLARVGTDVLHQLRQLEAVRIRRFWGHAGAELRRAVNWVDCDCGPMTSLMGHAIQGAGLCVLPPVEEADEGLQHAYRAKMDACWRSAVPAP